jgi:hypothetical protein
MNSYEEYLDNLKKSKHIHRKRKQEKDKFKKLKRNHKSKNGKKITRCNCDKCCKIRKERLNKNE